MAIDIVICFDPVTKKAVQCKTDEKDTFSKDNSHIKNEVITSGTPYIWRKEYSNPLNAPSIEQKNIVNQFALLSAQSRRNTSCS